jgi:hypothetical protein
MGSTTETQRCRLSCREREQPPGPERCSAAPATFLCDYPFAVSNLGPPLLLDPGVGAGQTVLERDLRCPAEDLPQAGVIRVAAAHLLRTRHVPLDNRDLGCPEFGGGAKLASRHGTCCRRPLSGLELDRCQHLQPRVAPLAVVDDLQVLEERGGQLQARRPDLPDQQLDLHAAPERLHESMVPARCSG